MKYIYGTIGIISFGVILLAMSADELPVIILQSLVGIAGLCWAVLKMEGIANDNRN